MKTIMWVNIASLKEQLKWKTQELEEETMWIGAISAENPAIKEMVKYKTNKILLWKDIKKQ